MSAARRIACVAAASLLAACSGESTAPYETQTDAALAAQTFSQLADSVTRTGGDADVGSAYSGIAGILRMGGRITPIELTIDGTTTTFIAAAMTTETTVDDCPAPLNCFAPPRTYVRRNLIAWDKGNHKRLVQLSSESNDEPIGAVLDPTVLAIYAPMASLIYMDGAGGTYIGTSGTQKFDVTKSNVPCPTVADSVKTGFTRPNAVCTLADHTVTFSGKIEPSPFFRHEQHGEGDPQHRDEGADRRRHPARDHDHYPPCDTACRKPIDSLPKPPVVERPSNELPAKLAASLDSVVNLKFIVVNPSKDPIKVEHSSGQKYDFVAIDSATGRAVWRWSADKSFIAALGAEPVPAGGTLTYVERWKPPGRGCTSCTRFW